MKVEYLDHMGSDLTVVDAARVSFNKKSNLDENGYLLEKDKKLIKYLAKNGHWTPFAHPQISIRVTVPIFIANQLKRHQVGLAVNEVSRRYVDESPNLYIPEVWRNRPDASIKQGSGANQTKEVNEELNSRYKKLLEQSLLLYEDMIQLNVAPEMARMVLPQSMYTSWVWTGSLSSFIRICKQRLDNHAQYEVQLVAQQIKNILIQFFPVSCEAYELI